MISYRYTFISGCLLLLVFSFSSAQNNRPVDNFTRNIVSFSSSHNVMPSWNVVRNIVSDSPDAHNIVSRPNSAGKKPNIIFIFTDDLGYGDIGVFFQNQRKAAGGSSTPYAITPSIDAMALSGARFTNQYCNAPVCAPSRASLLTGVHQGNAIVRNNQFDKALENNHTIATVLKEAGYSTMAIGKWGLQGVEETGPEWPAHPLKRGFDNYYGYIRHRDGHEHYPFEGKYRGKKEVYENYKNVSDKLAKCYTTDLWTAKAKQWIMEHHRADSSKPFFMYLAYDAPHAVLEIPTQPYPAGGGLQGGIQWLNEPGRMINTASGEIDSYIEPYYRHATYDHDKNPATGEIPWPETFQRYATSTKRIDDGVGDILQLLKDLNIDQNTMVVFTSDNGPSIESYLPDSYVMNSPVFFESYGPFDGIKRDVWEGGLRVPTVVSWPAQIPQGKIIDQPSMLSDWLATFADIADVPAPARTDGTSLLPSLTGKGDQKEGLVYVEYFENGRTPDFKKFEASRRNRIRKEMQLIRQGDLVGVRYNIQSAADDFEIYDVNKDPKQTTNLAGSERVKGLQVLMKARVLQLRHADSAAPRPYDKALIPPVQTARNGKRGWDKYFYPGNFPWVISEVGAEKDLKSRSGNHDEGLMENSNNPGEGLLENSNNPGGGLLENSTNSGESSTVQTRNPVESSTRQIRNPDNGLMENNNNHGEGLTVYTAFLKIPADGKYEFSFSSNSKAFVRLHEAAFFDADFEYKPHTELFKEVFLQAGFHPVYIYQLSNSSTKERVRLKWKKPGYSTWKSVKKKDLVSLNQF